jgi:hypothetical protein
VRKISRSSVNRQQLEQLRPTVRTFLIAEILAEDCDFYRTSTSAVTANNDMAEVFLSIADRYPLKIN